MKLPMSMKCGTGQNENSVKAEDSYLMDLVTVEQVPVDIVDVKMVLV